MLPRALIFSWVPRQMCFFGRFVSVLQATTVAWIAGLSRMNWWKFLLWSTAGGIVWATTVALTHFRTSGAQRHRHSALRPSTPDCSSPAA